MIYAIRLTLYCEAGCSLRSLTTRMADLVRATCDCGAAIVDFDAVTTTPCCGRAYDEEHAGHCPRVRRAT